MSRYSSLKTTIGNDKTFTGSSLYMVVQVGDEGQTMAVDLELLKQWFFTFDAPVPYEIDKEHNSIDIYPH